MELDAILSLIVNFPPGNMKLPPGRFESTGNLRFSAFFDPWRSAVESPPLRLNERQGTQREASRVSRFGQSVPKSGKLSAGNKFHASAKPF
jgi:hypothetical protein